MVKSMQPPKTEVSHLHKNAHNMTSLFWKMKCIKMNQVVRQKSDFSWFFK